jgi:phthiocerol/phenolphthiocerol synthesis type-I polyketide synthase E
MAVDGNLNPKDGNVAIVGMSGRFPGAGSVTDFWRNLCDGVESISRLSDADLDAAGVAPQRRFDSRYVRRAAVLDGVEFFDAGLFEMSAREAQITDPQHRLFLECAWQALEDAGCDPNRYPNEIGIFAGAGRNSYFLRNVSGDETLRDTLDDYQIIIGSEDDYLVTRVAFKLNLRGPAVTVQTACSTSLVAVHLACKSLLSGECQMALAGGVSVQVPQKAGYLYKDSGMYSPDGHTRPFDAHACGTVFGSGIGVVVLKPLAAALSEGDPIRAVIRGSAVNNDGASKAGFTAPSAAGQAAAIRRALAVAQVDPLTIDYVEAHGTGTIKGDPVEIEAIKLALGAGREVKTRCAISSVKGNVGHLDAASGITGLIKTVLALENEALPPTLNFGQANPACGLDRSGFFVNLRLTPWRRGSHPRRAGVTSLGFGGTNAHVILEEAPPEIKSGTARPWHLLVISAKTEAALEGSTQNLIRYLRENRDADLASVAFTLQTGRAELCWRRTAVSESVAAAAAALDSLDPSRVETACCSNERRPVTFLFPGHGSHAVNMTRDLYENEAVVRESIDACGELFREYFDLDLRQIIFPVAGREAEAAAYLEKAFYIQSALFVTSYALAMLWKSWGVQPDSVLGYSIGEVVAATVAGVISLPDAIRMTGERSRMMQQLPPGAMVAVALSEEELGPLIGDNLDIGAINGPKHTTVAGSHEAMEPLKRRLDQQRIPYKVVHVPHGYHSRMMDPIIHPYRDVAASVNFRPPELDFFSSLLGARATTAELSSPDYWTREAREAIRFSPAVEALAATKERIFLEVGPGQLLSKLVRSHPGVSKAHIVLSSCPSPQQAMPETCYALGTLGRLWLAGQPVNWAGVHGGERPRRVALPGYPFDRQRYWIERRNPDPNLTVVLPSVPPKLALEEWGAARIDTESSSSLPIQRARRQSLRPRNALEEQIVELWRQVLGIEEVDIQESFLELGGNSLMAVQLISRVRDVFGVDLPVGEFLRSPTITAMAEAVALGQAQLGKISGVEDLLSEIEALGTGEARALLARELEVSERDQAPESAKMAMPPPRENPNFRSVEFSLFFFSGDESAFPHDKYQLVLEATKFADRHGFVAVWTPERHFHRFGGLYPNPAVLGGALAAITETVQIRAGSVIAPLQSPIRIAEEWALVDNLSNGRVGVAFATGFHPVDFVLSPERFKERAKLTAEVVEAVRRYWRGEPAQGRTGTGEEVERVLFPRPVQRELPTWLTATRSTETFIQAGRLGVNVLTAVLRINREEMAEKIAAYRRARYEHGHDPDAGKVTLMLHTFAGPDDDQVRHIVSGPFREYLKSHMEFLGSTSASLSASEKENLLTLAFNRFYEGGSLFGTPESCLSAVEKFAAIGVNEIACLIDFGIDFDTTMDGLLHLARLAELANCRHCCAADLGVKPQLASLP